MVVVVVVVVVVVAVVVVEVGVMVVVVATVVVGWRLISVCDARLFIRFPIRPSVTHSQTRRYTSRSM